MTQYSEEEEEKRKQARGARTESGAQPEQAETATPLRPRETEQSENEGWNKPDWYGDAADNAAKAKAALQGARTPFEGEHALETAKRLAAAQNPLPPLKSETPTAPARGTQTESAQKAQSVQKAQTAQAAQTAAPTTAEAARTTTATAAETETPEQAAARIAALREKWAKDDAAEDERIQAERAARDKAWQDEYDAYGSSYNPQVSALREIMERNRAENEDEAKRREKTERSRKIIAAATDGLRALSNLYFVNRYAPNHYDYAKDGMTPKEDAAQAAAAKERQARADRRNNALVRLGDLLQGRAKGLAGLIAARDKIAAERAAADEARAKSRRERDLQPDKERKGAADADKAAADADKAAADAGTAKTKEKYAPKRQQAEIDELNARAKKHAAQGRAALINANKSGKGSGGNNDDWQFRARYNEANGGGWEYFKTKKAADDFAKQEGTYFETLQTETRTVTDQYGQTKTYVTDKWTGYPAPGEGYIYPGSEAGTPADGNAGGSYPDFTRYVTGGYTPKTESKTKEKPAGKTKQPNPANGKGRTLASMKW